MAINIITNFMVILLVLLALCALFPANTQATSSLSDKLCKCESEFWYKNSKHFKQSIKSKCLKENHHHEKRHRQHHICNKKSFNKKEILSKWEKFADCRCESTIAELSHSKNEKVSVCYQIVRLNKATGEFLGELSIFKKDSKYHYDTVAVKFNKGFVTLKQVSRSKCSIDKYYISGKLSKSESMNKISLDKVSPTKVKLIVDNGKSETFDKNEFATVPFSKFIFNGNIPDDKKNIIQKDHLIPDNKENKNKKDKKPPQPQDQSPPAQPPTDQSPPAQPPTDQPPAQSPTDQPPAQPPTDQPPAQPPTDQPPNQPPAPQDDTYKNNDKNTPSSPDSTPTTTGSSTILTNPQEVNNATPDAKNDDSKSVQNGAFVGSIVFGCIVAVGAAFIGYNTYERVRWRRQYRRRQAAQQNFPITNVPDYNGGYGRAY